MTEPLDLDAIKARRSAVDKELRDAVVTAIVDDATKPRADRLGLVDAMLAVIWPVLDRERSEIERLTAELATARAAAFHEAARVLEDTGRDDDAVNLLDNIAHGITTRPAQDGPQTPA